MSILKVKSVQLGFDTTATNNFTLGVPAVADGSVKLARGNPGLTTQDIFTVLPSGVITLQQPIIPYNELGMRNRVINGRGTIVQRSTYTGATNYRQTQGYVVDRWAMFFNGLSGTYSFQTGTGLSAYAGNQITLANYSTATPTGSQYCFLQHTIEGIHIADLRWGTSSAKPVTISLRANASQSMVVTMALRNNAATRSYTVPLPLTPSGAYYTVTIPGCTDGVWATDNSQGIGLSFALTSGSTYVSPTANTWVAGNYLAAPTQSNGHAVLNALFSITDVQLEQGTAATPFDTRLAALELQLCQRYYEEISGVALVGRPAYTFWPCQVSKRIGNPTVTLLTGSFGGSNTSTNARGMYQPDNTVATSTSGWSAAIDAEF